mgnify:CR=1 FL=1
MDVREGKLRANEGEGATRGAAPLQAALEDERRLMIDMCLGCDEGSSIARGLHVHPYALAALAGPSWSVCRVQARMNSKL